MPNSCKDNKAELHKIFAEKLYSIYEKKLKKDPIEKEIAAYFKKIKELSIKTGLSPTNLEPSLKEIAFSYHQHLEFSFTGIKENKLLPAFASETDKKTTPFGKAAIYLDNLLSSYNVAHILRTTEALRLGSVHFSKGSAALDKARLKKNSFGAVDIVSLYYEADLKNLPRPIIALDTFDETKSLNLFQFIFPKTFTLILGNEEKGISQEAQQMADLFLHIPMQGLQKSLNVASAFAMAAAQIKITS